MTETTEKKPGRKKKEETAEADTRPDQAERTLQGATARPKLKMKADKQFRHDLFKCELAMMKRNFSWQKGVVNIKQIEHVHFFHTYNSRGKKLRYTNTVGGHYHEIQWGMDEQTGELKATCGPPITDKYRKKANGRISKISTEISWVDGTGSEDRIIKDEHIHTVTYEESEYLNPHQIQSARDGALAASIEEGKRAQAAKDLGLQGY